MYTNKMQKGAFSKFYNPDDMTNYFTINFKKNCKYVFLKLQRHEMK